MLHIFFGVFFGFVLCCEMSIADFKVFVQNRANIDISEWNVCIDGRILEQSETLFQQCKIKIEKPTQSKSTSTILSNQIHKLRQWKLKRPLSREMTYVYRRPDQEKTTAETMEKFSYGKNLKININL